MESPTRSIAFVRHLEQTSHRRVDPPIRASQQAPDVSVPYDTILCSPYRRCRETAALINATRQKPLEINWRLSEYEGHKAKRVFSLEPATRQCTKGVTIPGPNETWDDCEARLDRVIDEIQALPGNTLVVTHGIVVRYAEKKLRGHTDWARGRDVPFGGGFTAILPCLSECK